MGFDQKMLKKLLTKIENLETTESESKNEMEKLTKEQEIELRDTELVRNGKKVIVPDGMSLDYAISFLQYKKEEESRVIAVKEVFDKLDPIEGALALNEALLEMFGITKLEKLPPKSFFDTETPPTYIRVPVSATTTVEIPVGKIVMPNITGYIEHTWSLVNGRPVFMIQGEIAGKDKVKFGDLTTLIKKIAKEKSVYKGKAIKVKFPEEPQVLQDFFSDFIDVSDVSENNLVFSDELEKLIKVTLFTPIEKTELCRKFNIPLKRGILLEGPFGVGKTLTANVTAKKCIENGWTFIYVSAAANIADAVELAKQYQPAVVFTEDIDRAVGSDRTESVDSILNRIDGILEKNTEVIVVLTTNNVESINQAMLRPGRLDAVISVRPPDINAVEKLIRLFAGGLIKPTEDLTGVSRKLNGQIPAVIREVVERAKLAAIERSDSPDEVTAEDMEISATGMLNHINLLIPKTVDNRSPIEKAAAIVTDAITGVKTVKANNKIENGHNELLLKGKTL